MRKKKNKPNGKEIVLIGDQKTDFPQSFVLYLKQMFFSASRVIVIIREFIEKVYVYHPEKINGQKTQRVRIVWNCIGEIPTQK